MVRFVDNDEIVTGGRTLLTGPTHALVNIQPAECLEADHIRVGSGRQQGSFPHVHERRRRDNEWIRKPPRHCKRNVSFTHPDIVTEQRTTELIDRNFETLGSRALMWVKRYRSDPDVRGCGLQKYARYPGPHLAR